MHIQINIIIREGTENLKSVEDSLVSTQHLISPYIFDYRLNKTTIDSQIPVLSYDFEDFENHKYHLLALYEDQQNKPDAFIKIVDNVYPVVGFIDLIDDFNDDNIGASYFDFNMGINESFVFYQKSMPVVSNMLPIVVFSFKKFVENIGSDNPEGLILTQYASKHISEIACSVQA